MCYNKSMHKIYCNAGHFTGTNNEESKLAIKVRDELKKIYPAVYVPDNLDLRKSIDFINNKTPDFAFSIHFNQNNNPQRRGVEVYYSDNPYNARVLSKALAKRLMIPNGGAIHESQSWLKNLAFLHLKSPSVIIECGYLSNEYDRRALDPARTARGIRDGLNILFPPLQEMNSLLESLKLSLQKLLSSF